MKPAGRVPAGCSVRRMFKRLAMFQPPKQSTWTVAREGLAHSAANQTKGFPPRPKLGTNMARMSTHHHNSRKANDTVESTAGFMASGWVDEW